MDRSLKKIIAVISAAILALLIYYGSWLPYQKSVAYISTLRNLHNLRSLQDFEDSFTAVLDMPSPIGQEELVRNLGNVVLGLVQGSGKDHPEIVAPVMQYLTNYYKPILDYGRGMSFAQNLYIMAAGNYIAYTQTHNQDYLKQAQHYYEWGLQVSPTRPQFLYGVYQVYIDEGDIDHAKATAEQIVAQWPADQDMKANLQKLQSAPVPPGAVVKPLK